MIMQIASYWLYVCPRSSIYIYFMYIKVKILWLLVPMVFYIGFGYDGLLWLLNYCNILSFR